MSRLLRHMQRRAEEALIRVKQEISESRTLERQLKGMRVMSYRGDLMVDWTCQTKAEYRARRAWAIVRARWNIRDLNRLNRQLAAAQ
jgi:hypothetical protein